MSVTGGCLPLKHESQSENSPYAKKKVNNKGNYINGIVKKLNDKGNYVDKVVKKLNDKGNYVDKVVKNLNNKGNIDVIVKYSDGKTKDSNKEGCRRHGGMDISFVNMS